MKHSKLMITVGIALVGLMLNANAAMQVETTSGIGHGKVEQGTFIPLGMLDNTLHDLGSCPYYLDPAANIVK